MGFAPQRRAIFHFSAKQLPPHPPLYQAYFSKIRTTSHRKNTAIRDFPNIWRMCNLLSSDSTRVLIFFLLTWLLWSAFQPSISSEVGLLNFLRWGKCIESMLSLLILVSGQHSDPPSPLTTSHLSLWVITNRVCYISSVKQKKRWRLHEIASIPSFSALGMMFETPGKGWWVANPDQSDKNPRDSKASAKWRHFHVPFPDRCRLQSMCRSKQASRLVFKNKPLRIQKRISTAKWKID